MNAPFDSSQPIIAELMVAALGLSKSSTPSEISAILKQAAAIDLMPLEIEALLDRIKGQTGAKISSLRKEYKTHQQNAKLSIEELAEMIAIAVLDKHFAGGALLRRGVDGSYWEYGGTHWVETESESIKSHVFRCARSAPFAGLIEKVVPTVNAAARLIDFLTKPIADPVGFMDEPAPVINCVNGELWVGEGGEPELRPHSPHSLQTTCLPIEYDPAAECSLFDKAISEIFSNAQDPEGMVRHFLEFSGYAIQPERDIPVFWLLIGHGGNGKSKLLETIARCIGHAAITYRSLRSMKADNFATASLAGKYLLIDDDMAENTVLSDGLIKAISERKLQTARHAYGRRAFTFISRAMPVMVGNNYPRTSDVSFGIIRRAQVIPFARKFSGDSDDPSLFPNIWENEMPGVLNRFIEGLVQLRQRGDFHPPIDCEEAFNDFMIHANPLVGFFDECCVPDPDGRIRLKDLWLAMSAWSKAQGIRISFGRNGLKRKLDGLGHTIKSVKGYPTLYGFSLHALSDGG